MSLFQFYLRLYSKGGVFPPTEFDPENVVRSSKVGWCTLSTFQLNLSRFCH
jgi:hypothetical protein